MSHFAEVASLYIRGPHPRATSAGGHLCLLAIYSVVRVVKRPRCSLCNVSSPIFIHYICNFQLNSNQFSFVTKCPCSPELGKKRPKFCAPPCLSICPHNTHSKSESGLGTSLTFLFVRHVLERVQSRISRAPNFLSFSRPHRTR